AQIAAGCPAARAGAKETWITDSTGAGIGALELGTGPKGVVLAHMAGGDSCQWLPFGQQLAAAGYHVVVFDFGGSGVSDPLAGQDRRDANVIGAAAYLHGHGALNVVLVGASMGGTAALVAANEVSPAVHGVVSLSAPASYQGMDAAAAVKKLSAPVLYIAGAGDGQYASAARALYADTPGKAKTLLLASGAQHGTMLLAKQEADAARVRTAILDFLKQTLS
ncbi:MAG TPA: alpha/beta hydrolase, partial [Rugosimonospora sp.]|nr:alpha/beta hydrolase [Rugosimonospora sp.]